MIAKYPGKCSKCGVEIPKGAECDYNAETRTIAHRVCPSAADSRIPEDIASELHFIDADLIGSAAIPAAWTLPFCIQEYRNDEAPY